MYSNSSQNILVISKLGISTYHKVIINKPIYHQLTNESWHSWKPYMKNPHGKRKPTWKTYYKSTVIENGVAYILLQVITPMLFLFQLHLPIGTSLWNIDRREIDRNSERERKREGGVREREKRRWEDINRINWHDNCRIHLSTPTVLRPLHDVPSQLLLMQLLLGLVQLSYNTSTTPCAACSTPGLSLK